MIKDDYRNKTLALFKNVAYYVGVKLDQKVLEKDVDDIFNLELAIAKTINTREKFKRNYARFKLYKNSNKYQI